MSLTREEQRVFLRALMDRPLDLEREEDRQLYQPLHDKDHDPVERLFATIEGSGRSSTQAVAGFRGTGKTTELSRLARMLRAAGHLVVKIDLDAWLDMHATVAIGPFLLQLAGAIGEGLADDRLLGAEIASTHSYWDRGRRFLGEQLGIGDLAADPEAIRQRLRTDPALRERIRVATEGDLERTSVEVCAYHRELVEALTARWGKDPRLVVILDSLEHLRGGWDQIEPVLRSAEALVLTQRGHLALPDTHLVMTVPAGLLLVANSGEGGSGSEWPAAWPACRVQRSDGSPDPLSIARMVKLVERRGPWRSCLPEAAALEQLVLASGGEVRGLLNMMVEAVHQAGQGVHPDSADRICAAIRRAYLPLFSDERQLLRRIAETHRLAGLSAKEQLSVLRFFDSNLALCYLDEARWFDVHPLIRSEILDG